MENTAALLLTGAIAGLSVAVPVGPFSLLCIQRSLRGGFLFGFSTGMGGATVNVAQAGLLLFGLHRLPEVPGGDRILTALGGLMLLWSAVRTLRTRPHHLQPAGAGQAGAGQAEAGQAEAGQAEAGQVGAGQVGARQAARCAPAYLSAVAFNSANPFAVVLLLAALSPVLGAGTPPAPHALLMVAGMTVASSAWYGCLSLLVCLLRARLGTALLGAANRLAGCALALYAAFTLAGACGL